MDFLSSGFCMNIEDNELDVGDALLDTIELYNLVVYFLKKKDQKTEIKKLIRSTMDHLQCWFT